MAFIVGEFGAINKTTDAGSNWNEVYSNSNFTLWSISVFDQNNACAVGENLSGIGNSVYGQPMEAQVGIPKLLGLITVCFLFI